MPSRHRLTTWALAAALLAPTVAAAQQSRPAQGRIAVHVFSGSVSDTRDGTETSTRTSQVTTSFAWRSTESDGAAEFGLDGRSATYPGSTRQSRTSLYDGYVGYRLAGGTFGVRAGQMWLTDLGGLGSVAGLFVQARKRDATAVGTIRGGAFAGLEPSTLDFGYAPSVRKAGGFIAIEGAHARRHVLGFVTVRNSGLTERSVISASNFIPAGPRVFIYQASEYDLKGPAGQGSGGLTYWLTNARASVGSHVEVQGSYHHGRSVDTRSLTLDVLHGRPVSTASLAGLTFESVGGRIWLTPVQHVRVNVGYARDRNNRDDQATVRYNVGASATNLARHGIDLTINRASVTAPTRTYVAWDASAGVTLGGRFYLTGDFTTALSSLHLTPSTAEVLFETHPRTRRYSVSGLANMSRRYSLLVNLDLTQESQLRDVREMAGLMIRF